MNAIERPHGQSKRNGKTEKLSKVKTVKIFLESTFKLYLNFKF